MFSSGPSYTKLKTNLRLAINRLKLLEKKKTELTQKARKEIADYLAAGKTERAKIRVEHIIREDYLVEAMEVTEMYCDLLLARFGLIQQMKDLDEGLAEAISSLIWAAPRLSTDVAELKVIADQLALKYGKPYALACREQGVGTISEKLVHKLGVQAPPKVLIEKYLVEIAKNFNVEYEPDTQVMREAEWGDDPLISLGGEGRNNLGGGGGGGGGDGREMNIPPMGFSSFDLPEVPGQTPQPAAGAAAVAPAPQPFSYPQQKGASGMPPNLPAVPPYGGQHYPGGTAAYHPQPPPPDPNVDTMSPSDKISNNYQFGGGSGTLPDDFNNYPPPPYTSLPSYPPATAGVPRPSFPPDVAPPPAQPPKQESDQPKPAPRSKFGDENSAGSESSAPPMSDFSLPNLPEVPDLSATPSPSASVPPPPRNDTNNEDIDFDDLTRRFEDLKKKK